MVGIGVVIPGGQALSDNTLGGLLGTRAAGIEQGDRVASLVWNAGAVTVYRIRFEGPAALAVRVATALADADGVELTSSEQPSILDETKVELNVSVEGNRDAVAVAVSSIRDELPDGASIEIADE